MLKIFRYFVDCLCILLLSFILLSAQAFNKIMLIGEYEEYQIIHRTYWAKNHSFI